MNEKTAKLLVSKYGSPLFVISEDCLENTVSEIKTALSKHYPNHDIFYSLKTNYIPAIALFLKKRGIKIEVVSGFEYWLAKKIGCLGDEIVFNGPDKKDVEIESALEDGSIVNVDNHEELERITYIAKKNGKCYGIGLRINTNIITLNENRDTFERFPNKYWWRFGFNIENGAARNAISEITSNPNYLNLKGIHIHLGTHLKSSILYRDIARRISEFIRNIEIEYNVKIFYIDFGGGYYKTPIEDYVREIAPEFKKLGNNIRLIIESGTYLINDATSLVATVLHTDIQKGIQKVTVDTSTSHLFTGNFNKLPVIPLCNTKSDLKMYPSVIFGNSCVSSDVLSETILPELKRGDIILFPEVGAYTISRSEQFIFPRPPVLLQRRGGDYTSLRTRERYEDFIVHDIF